MFQVNCFYPLKFTSLTINGKNPPLKTILIVSLVQIVSVNSRQSFFPSQLTAQLKPSKLSSSEES